MVLDVFGVQQQVEIKLRDRLVSAYRKHLYNRDENTSDMAGRRGGYVRRAEEGVFEALEGIGISKERAKSGSRPLDEAYWTLRSEALRIVFVTGDEKIPAKVQFF